MKYTIILVPQKDGGYTVEVPALPGCCTQGETREEAVAMAREAIELYLASCKACCEPIPEESGVESLIVEIKDPEV